MFILSFLFFLTAILYSSVGFGGGSTYLALLLIWGIPYHIFPVIALCCNIIVVSGNCFNYLRTGNINIRLLRPYLISSIPLAYIGGSLSINKQFFEILLFIILSLAGFLLILKIKSFDNSNEDYKKIPRIISILVGGLIGFISGVVGIGGGIFLSPILLLLKAGKVKDIATTASLFILINSIAGLGGQFTKNFIFYQIYDYWPLFIIVLLGGQIGNFLNIKIFPIRLLTLVTAALVLFVAIRMGFKLFV
ncbi:sulfite exporter TauE/SafE family protein [Candidatus Pelagibacter sp.]|nr:sulfite exporter TauE/SafE family protein [Candidatus Pelagibacter sp.]